MQPSYQHMSSMKFVSTLLLNALSSTAHAFALPTLDSTGSVSSFDQTNPAHGTIQPSDQPNHVFFCENENFTPPCYYLSSPHKTCWSPEGDPLKDTDGNVRIFGYNASSGADDSALPPSSGNIASFGPDEGTVCRLYVQPRCEGDVGDSGFVRKPGSPKARAWGSGPPYKSWKCVDLDLMESEACTWE
jgi:hypothetical protein